MAPSGYHWHYTIDVLLALFAFLLVLEAMAFLAEFYPFEQQLPWLLNFGNLSGFSIGKLVVLGSNSQYFRWETKQNIL